MPYFIRIQLIFYLILILKEQTYVNVPNFRFTKLQINSKSYYRSNTQIFKRCYILSIKLKLRMIEEDDLDRKYDELLGEYNKAKDALKHIEKSKKEIEKLIQHLEQELKAPPASSLPAKQEGSSSNANELAELIKNAKLAHEKQQQQHESKINELANTLKNLQNQASAEGERVISLSEEEKKRESAITDLKKEAESVSQQLVKGKASISESEALLIRLEKQVKDAENKQKSQLQQEQNQNKQKESEFHALQKELKSLQAQVHSLDKQLADETSKKELFLKKGGEATQAKINQTAKLVQNNKIHKQQIASLTEKIDHQQKALDQLNHVAAEHQNTIKSLEGDYDQLQKSIEQLNRKVNENKKAKEQAAKEQQKGKKGGRNYKLELVQAQKDKEILLKELNREKQKLTDTLELKKSYVSQQNLDILKRELQRHKQARKPSLFGEETKNKKLKNQNKILKDRIDFLLKAEQNIIKEKEVQLNQSRSKHDEFINTKNAQQKLINTNTNKLNDYIKEFPDHQKQKEERRAQHRKQLQQQRQKQKQLQEIERKRKKDKGRNKHVEQSEEDEQKALNSLMALDEQIILPVRDETAIYNNKNFQYAVALVAILIVVGLSFS